MKSGSVKNPLKRRFLGLLFASKGKKQDRGIALNLCEEFGMDPRDSFDTSQQSYLTKAHRGGGLEFGDIEWTGGYLVTKGMSSWNIIHEVAHFQCASPVRRRMPEYGLGGLNHSLPNVLPQDQIQIEECRACALQILWDVHLGFDATIGAREVNLLTWSHLKKRYTYTDWDGDEPAEKCLLWLIQEGLVTSDLTPTRNLRKSPDARYMTWGEDR